jgi:Putative peptidoglycan binding domain
MAAGKPRGRPETAGSVAARAPGRRFAAALCAGAATLVCYGLPRTASAQSLDAPEEVCISDGQVEVEWTGPNATGDRITFAVPTAAPDVFLDAAPTAEGSPATLELPELPGMYEIRYVRGTPLAVLARRDILVKNCDIQLSRGGTCPVPSYPPESYAVIVHGVQSDSGTEISSQQGFTLDQLCGAADALAPVLGDLLSRVEAPLNVPVDTISANVSSQLENMRNAVCPPDEDSGTEYFFTITYAHCRMAMDTGQYSMDIHLPPGSGDGMMSMADHAAREVTQMRLQRDIAAVNNVIGSGWSDDIQMTPTSRSGSHIGLPTTEYAFSYQSGLGLPGIGALDETDVTNGAITMPQVLGNLVSVRNEGTVWSTQCAPGIDIIQTFYENLSREVQPDQGTASFIAGIINNNVGMLDKGLPLEIEHTVSSRIAGATMVRGSSHAVVTGFDVVPLPPQWCEQSLMPGPDEGYTFIDIDQQISDALGGAGGAGGAGSGQGDAVAAGLQQLNEAMEQLTPEQREMLNQFGLGGLGGLSQAPAPSPAPSRAGRAGPSSADLYSDDLTQTVQNYLQALGYDPGNTDGELSTETIIAISQFQAEKGLEVTGEVTPQLAGILAAEVDR